MLRSFALALLSALSLSAAAARPAPIDLSGNGIEGTAFEICVNGRIVRSDSRSWAYAGSQTVSAPNGAWTTTYHLSGKGRLKGLHAYIDRQHYDGSGLIRERLRLSSDIEGRYRLTNVRGHNHLVFPIHRFYVPAGTCVIDETKLGSFVLKRDKGNHSFFPTRERYMVEEGQTVEFKGPLAHITSADLDLIWSYEHASQDGDVIQKTRKKHVSDASADAAQGVTGDLYEIRDDDLWFIATQVSMDSGMQLVISNRIRHGGYLDGEFIPAESCYETVWSMVSMIPEGQMAEEAFNDYLYDKIANSKPSRRHEFYYNTWGMQRDYPSAQLYTIYTQENILREISLAGEMGLDRFVLDDGWEQAMGQWTCNAERLPDGLAPFVKAIRDEGMIPGIWISPLATTDTSAIYREHPDWLIRDKRGDPVLGQWNCPVIDLGSPYYDMLLGSLKDLVDQGFKYFKWDGINTFNSTLEGFRGIGGSGSDREKIDRYNYQFPFYITSLMRELREHDPEVVVEIDLTENERALIGLMLLQEGKFYYINNGNSGYRDYSAKNSNAKRRALSETAGVLPPEVITLSVYPNDAKGALRHNVHTVLAGGHGFWGRLDATTPEQRAWIRETLHNAKRVLAHTAGHPLYVDNPDVRESQLFSQSDPESGYAIITAFGKGTGHFDGSKAAGVIGCPFENDGELMAIRFEREDGEDSSAAFVIGAEKGLKRVVSSTGILGDLSYDISGKLHVTAATDTEIKVSGMTGTTHLKAGESADF